MHPPTSARHARKVRSSQDLPYGPLPVRREPSPGPIGGPPLDQLVDLSWLGTPGPSRSEAAVSDADSPRGDGAGPAQPTDERGGPEAVRGRPADDETFDTGHEPDAGDDVAGPGTASLSLTDPRPEADDDVHFGVAARALGVSRKTVERMVKRGQLERGPSNGPATVSKRSLVTTLEARRRDVSHLTRANEIEQAKASEDYPAVSSAPTSALTELAPVLAPLLDEFVAARTRAAVLERELEQLRARAGQDRTRDELLLALATTGWWGRRKTRRAVLRQYVLGEHPDSGSAPG